MTHWQYVIGDDELSREKYMKVIFLNLRVVSVRALLSCHVEVGGLFKYLYCCAIGQGTHLATSRRKDRASCRFYFCLRIKALATPLQL